MGYTLGSKDCKFKSIETDNTSNIVDSIRKECVLFKLKVIPASFRNAEDKSSMVDVFAGILREDYYIFKVNKMESPPY